MEELSFQKLTPVEFEGFCYDLLAEMGLVNINWRRGTGLPSSPSDQGRDIECEKLVIDIDGERYIEKWFIECKHKNSVSVSDLQAGLGWTNAERAHVFLIITSGFLSNPTKNYIESYKKNTDASFRIKYWERKDLERLAISKVEL